MNRFARFLNRIGDYSFMVCMAAIVALMVIITATTLARYIFNYGILWSFEGSGYLQLVLVYLPAMYILQKDRHVKMSLITDRMSGRARHGLLTVGSLAGLAFSAFFALESWKQTIEVIHWGTRSVIARIPESIPWSVMLVGLVLLSLQFLIEAGRHAAIAAGKLPLEEKTHAR